MEIKVRFWDVRHQEMVYPPFFTSRDLVEDEGWKVMLRTGLKDRKGIEVYAGDVCNIKEHGACVYCVAEVIWGCEHGWAFRSYYNGKGNGDFFGVRFTGVSEVEVIGNIHQHADLLTQEGK